MNQTINSICYYPTTIVFVDDNKDYLKKILPRFIKMEKLSCLSYDDAQKALDFLVTEYQANPFINHCLIKEEDNPSDRIIVDFDIRAIHQEIYNKKRSSEITVLIVDYAMPGVNGLDFCRKVRKHLSNTALKIIMLTGEASKDLAVDAFNEGVINKFILKDTPNLVDVLIQNIQELQLDYFINLSETALRKTIDSETLFSLKDTVFIEFFNELRKTHFIAEYYLMDEQGSFLMLNRQGKPSFLAMANQDMMKTYLLYAEGDKAPIPVIEGIKSRKMMPFFLTEEDFNVRPAEWQPYMHPAQVLKGQETYYYSYIENPDPAVYKLKGNIFSYEAFLKSQE